MLQTSTLCAPFALEITATLLIHPLLVGVAGISRQKGASLQGSLEPTIAQRFTTPASFPIIFVEISQIFNILGDTTAESVVLRSFKGIVYNTLW